MKGSNCCILYNLPLPGAQSDELDVLDQVEYIEKAFDGLGIMSFRSGITLNFMAEMAEMAGKNPDFIFNLVESINNKGELCYFIPALLNMYSIPYTGSPLEAMFLTTSKILTAKALRDSGIKGPSIYKPSEHRLLKPGNRYIIKPVWEDGSLGITGDSVFTFEPGKEKELSVYSDSHWLIQDFIDGREFNITLLAGSDGVEVMPAAEILFRDYSSEKPRIVDYKAKWDLESFEYKNTLRAFPGESLDLRLRDKIETAALRCWDLFGLKGYARVDMRVDNNNEPYVIEVNANPCLSSDSGVVAATVEAGLTFTEVVYRIINDLNR